VISESQASAFTLAVFFEDKFAFLGFILVFTSSTIFTTFAFILRLSSLVMAANSAYHDGVCCVRMTRFEAMPGTTITEN
jgi:hypothetical protein